MRVRSTFRSGCWPGQRATSKRWISRRRMRSSVGWSACWSRGKGVQAASFALASRFKLTLCSAAIIANCLCTIGGMRTRNSLLYFFSANSVGTCSPLSKMSVTASSTTHRMPLRVACGVLVNQLNDGNSLHRAKCSLSSGDQAPQ